MLLRLLLLLLSVATGGIKRTGKTGGGSGGRKGDQYGRYLKKDGDAGEETTLGSNFPEVMWVSISNKGRDLDDDLEDRAAVYIKEDNLRCLTGVRKFF